MKAVFLDRDGTINIDKGYVHKIEDFEYLPGALEGLELLQKKEYVLFFVTNQSGIARGLYTEEQYKELEEWMIKDLQMKGIEIEKVFYCPHHPQAVREEYRVECNCRKPNVGLFLKAAEEYQICLDEAILIGDRWRDLELCRETKARGFLLYCKEERQVNNVFMIKGGILEAANIIVSGGANE